MQDIIQIGVDLAKNVIQVHAVKAGRHLGNRTSAKPATVANWSPTAIAAFGSRWTLCARKTCSKASGPQAKRPGKSGNK